MHITLDVKPVKFTGRTKNDVMSKIISNFGCFFISGCTNQGVSYSAYRKQGVPFSGTPGDFVLFNLVKFRHKNRDTSTGRQHVRDAHWDAYVYVVPAALVKNARQGARNFKLVVG